jgi:hypothetical protein
MHNEVLCDHSKIAKYRNKKGQVIFACCATCGLPPDTPPLVGYPGELEAWWEYKPMKKEEIDACRPNINHIQETKVLLRENANLLIELLALEAELGDEPSGLMEELIMVNAQRRAMHYDQPFR